MIWMLWLCKIVFITYINNDALVPVRSLSLPFLSKQQQLYPLFKGPSQKQQRLSSFTSQKRDSSNSLTPLSLSSSWIAEEDGIYSPFAEYAWSKLEEHGFIESSNTKRCHDVDNASSPTPLKKTNPDSNTTSNTTPVTTQVHIHVKSYKPSSFSSDLGKGQNSNDGSLKSWNALRYGRFALLETKNNHQDNNVDETNSKKNDFNHAKGGNYVTSNAIHVLNLVLFPNLSPTLDPPLPVLGVDLVTLPGNKHLIAIDFQPTTDTLDTKGTKTFLPKQYEQLESKLKSIHDSYVVQKRDVIPWGGDIPPNAQRFFSPFALWTRIGGPTTTTEDCIEIIQTHIWHAFCAYFDLYLELLSQVQDDLAAASSDINNECDSEISLSQAVLGQKDYLNYRMENDPARPMLNRLYGKEWAEELIETVLFPSI